MAIVIPPWPPYLMHWIQYLLDSHLGYSRRITLQSGCLDKALARVSVPRELPPVVPAAASVVLSGEMHNRLTCCSLQKHIDKCDCDQCQMGVADDLPSLGVW